MRGRIGRGAHDSYCILLSSSKSESARQRLRVLEQSNDGFRIAEEDLKLRGPGELLGQQQSGMPNFRFGDLMKDMDLILRARQAAVEFFCKLAQQSSRQSLSSANTDPAGDTPVLVSSLPRIS